MTSLEAAMMGRQTGDQAVLFYEFRLADRIPKDHLLRRINVVVGPVLDGVRGQLKPYYSQIGRPSIDPELMIRMLIVGYCFGLRSERRLTQEVELHLAYRWFCRLDLDDKVPHFSRETLRAKACQRPRSGRPCDRAAFSRAPSRPSGLKAHQWARMWAWPPLPRDGLRLDCSTSPCARCRTNRWVVDVLRVSARLFLTC
jgi:hypothetical protein